MTLSVTKTTVSKELYDTEQRTGSYNVISSIYVALQQRLMKTAVSEQFMPQPRFVTGLLQNTRQKCAPH